MRRAAISKYALENSVLGAPKFLWDLLLSYGFRMKSPSFSDFTSVDDVLDDIQPPSVAAKDGSGNLIMVRQWESIEDYHRHYAEPQK